MAPVFDVRMARCPPTQTLRCRCSAVCWPWRRASGVSDPSLWMCTSAAEREWRRSGSAVGGSGATWKLRTLSAMLLGRGPRPTHIQWGHPTHGTVHGRAAAIGHPIVRRRAEAQRTAPARHTPARKSRTDTSAWGWQDTLGQRPARERICKWRAGAQRALRVDADRVRTVCNARLGWGRAIANLWLICSQHAGRQSPNHIQMGNLGHECAVAQ